MSGTGKLVVLTLLVWENDGEWKLHKVSGIPDGK